MLTCPFILICCLFCTYRINTDSNLYANYYNKYNYNKNGGNNFNYTTPPTNYTSFLTVVSQALQNSATNNIKHLILGNISIYNSSFIVVTHLAYFYILLFPDIMNGDPSASSAPDVCLQFAVLQMIVPEWRVNNAVYEAFDIKYALLLYILYNPMMFPFDLI